MNIIDNFEYAITIIRLVSKDYTQALLTIKTNVGKHNSGVIIVAKDTLKNCKRFFKGKCFKELTCGLVNGVEFMKSLDKMLDEELRGVQNTITERILQSLKS